MPSPIPRVSECPLDPEAFITSYLDGKLPADELAYLEKHLQNCDSCSELCRELQIRHSLDEYEQDSPGIESDSSPDSTVVADSGNPPAPKLRAKPESIKYTIGGRPDQKLQEDNAYVATRAWLNELWTPALWFFKILGRIPLLGSWLRKLEPSTINKFVIWSLLFAFSVIPIYVLYKWPSLRHIATTEKKIKRPAKAKNFFESQIRNEFRRNSHFFAVKPALNGITNPVVQFDWKHRGAMTRNLKLTLTIYSGGEIEVTRYREAKPPLIHQDGLAPGTYYWTLGDSQQLYLVSKFEVR